MLGNIIDIFKSKSFYFPPIYYTEMLLTSQLNIPQMLITTIVEASWSSYCAEGLYRFPHFIFILIMRSHGVFHSVKEETKVQKVNFFPKCYTHCV